MLCGVYGIYAFNSRRRRRWSDSEAAWNNDSGFYIGQTPPQTKPIRSIVRNVKSYGNVLGFSGTNMRYVTITKSQWFNNGTRHRPQRARQREVRAAGGQRHHRQRHLLEQLQLLRGRAVQAAAAGDGRRRTRSASASCSSAGARTEVERQPDLRQLPRRRRRDPADPAQAGRTPQTSIGNQVHDNQFGLGGADLNGRDLFYDGNGTDNCFGPNSRRRRPRRRPTARRSRRARSPGPNTFNAGRPGRGDQLGVGDPRTRRSGSGTRTPPSPASRRWSTTRSESALEAIARSHEHLLAVAGVAALAAAPAPPASPRPSASRRRSASRSSTTSTARRS